MPKNLDYVLEFTPKAREDVREIVLWYRGEREGLEDRFLLSLKASTDILLKNPRHYQIKFESVRALLLKRFPYRLYYFMEGNLITVLGVVHTKRSPKLIRKRLK